MRLHRLAASATSILIAVGIGGCAAGDEAKQQDPAAVIWAVGDGADGGDAARDVAERISAEPFDRFLYLGDVYDDGTREEFERNYDTVYGDLSQRTASTPGNHDWENRDEGYDPYWAEVHGKPIEPWYAFEMGGWEVLSLNSEEPVELGSPQHDWLEDRLTEPNDCRIAFFHSPRFSASEEHHGDDSEMEALWEALKGHATIVIGGHDHDMQRFKPVDGMTQFVSGAGGHYLYELADDPRLAFGNDSDYGALRLELRPGVATHSFVTADGEELDRGSLRCQRPGAE